MSTKTIPDPLSPALITPIGIVGLGVSGRATQKLLSALGIPSDDILTFDQKSPQAQFQLPERFLQEGKPKTLVVSPGVPLSTPWIQKALDQGVVLTSELELASLTLKNEKIIAITGSIGKSTTTCLLESALREFSTSFFVGGNLGTPLAHYATQVHLKERPRADWIVLELSSYQLENFSRLKSLVSAITYLTANHLERYANKDDYYRTKWALEEHTEQHLVLNRNGGDLHDFAQKQTPKIPWTWTDSNDPLMERYQLTKGQLIGRHNLDNIALAAQIAALAQWPPSAFNGLKKFPGLPHRVENLGVHRGLRFINDSKATTIESVKTAVQSALEDLPESRRLHLLLGGRDKNLPWQDLSPLQRNKQILFYFFGECRTQARMASGLNGPEFLPLRQALEAATRAAQPGDTLLLSPGGTSLDEFKSFEERGEAFRSYVQSLLMK